MNNENTTMETSSYTRGKYSKKAKQPLTEEQIKEKKEKAKLYAMEYYQKNKEKILERVKSNINKNRVEKKPNMVTNGRGRPPIHYFVSDNNDVILKEESNEVINPVDDKVLKKRQYKKEYMRQYRKLYPDRVRDYVRRGVKKYYDKHSIELTEKKKQQYRDNKEKILERLHKKRAEMKLLKEQEKEQQ